MTNLIPATNVELEEGRLSALVATVFSGDDERKGHYNHRCDCSNCNETRQFLDAPDLAFINSISQALENSDLTAR